MSLALGIDVGATGIKGAIIDTAIGELHGERIRYSTPPKAKPQEVIDIISQIVSDAQWQDKPFGLGLPTIMQNGIARTAVNIHEDWIDFPIEKALKEQLNVSVKALNDADAAGVSEQAFGEVKDVPGTCLLITLGTGVGTALFTDGKLVPNTELGQVLMSSGIAEKYVANSVREREELGWKEYGKRLNEYLRYMEALLSPTKIVISGGVSKKFHKYSKHIKLGNATVVPAKLLNNAGIIGAAMIGQKS